VLLDRRNVLQWMAAAAAAACQSKREGGARGRSAIETRPLDGMHWPTPDPFLFCAHHDDAYPTGNPVMGPQASLAGRRIGSDFAGPQGKQGGWRMYHGHTVPGFPQHPHRGFETVTVVRRGLLDHSDSLGARARYGRGDVQWLTAGHGILHAEMFPLVEQTRANPVELFQIWLNLPRKAKLVQPRFGMLWNSAIPRFTHRDDAGRGTEITLVAGALAETRALPPPPDSWAHATGSEVAIWTIKMQPGARWTLPAASSGLSRWLYAFQGGLAIDGAPVAAQVAVLRSDEEAALQNSADETELLLLQGRPIGEPVVQQGPFVMTTREEIRDTIAEYQATRFGGWRWDSDEPVHPATEGRFAQHADGTIEHPT
jgi:redox-sensitive bicupin YhaK (pirin superfamily)